MAVRPPPPPAPASAQSAEDSIDNTMKGRTPSARSRAKKKAREEHLEVVAQTMTKKVEALAQSINDMNREISFLRGLVADRDGRQTLEAHYTLNQLHWPHAQALEVGAAGQLAEGPGQLLDGNQ
ncbi:hypothetical protein HKX48_003807 [Thoreauomyces humboldtii]|nr:hypothetical protein HKX48_003807 [Thoreauomyces humboldtii]